MPERVIINETTGESLEIPDAIVAADPTEHFFVEVPHSDKKLADAGVKVRLARSRRPLVEQYVAASPNQRKSLLADAVAKHDAFSEEERKRLNPSESDAASEAVPEDLPPAA
jgi:hypothetical protein